MASSQVIVFGTRSYVDVVLPAYRRSLSHLVKGNQRGKPIVLLFGGKFLAKEAYGAIGRGGWRKPMPSCNDLDMPTSNWSFVAR